MVYYKSTDEDGFLFVSSLNAESGGNCTKEEHDTIAEMYRNAEIGYGVKEVGGEFVYAQRPIPPEPDPDPEEALSILLGDAEV